MKLNSNFIVRKIMGEGFLIPTGESQLNGMISLNETGMFIVENLKKVESAEEMAKLISENYEISYGEALMDTFEFFSKLTEAGAIE